MRELLILRHAKSRWDEPETDDHDRSLAPRGIAAARRMGQLIAERDWLPDLVLCSTALRARATLDLAREAWPKAEAVPVQFLSGLYMAAPGEILGIIRQQPADKQRLLVVGHNPGLQGFVTRLAGSGDRHLRQAAETKLPTAALVRLTVPMADWSGVDWGTARLEGFDVPKKLDGTTK